MAIMEITTLDRNSNKRFLFVFSFTVSTFSHRHGTFRILYHLLPLSRFISEIYYFSSLQLDYISKGYKYKYEQLFVLILLYRFLLNHDLTDFERSFV